MVQELLTIGSRGSPLALAQSRLTRSMLAASFGIEKSEIAQQIPIKTYTTTGDQLQDRSLVDAGGKGLFTKELEVALFEGDIDVAVHSMKDVPVFMPEGLQLAGMLPREDPREALIAKTATNLSELPLNPVIGTASVRRQAQVLRARPDAKIEMLRGNVGTRLRRLEEGRFDATFLALAGLKRLDMANCASGVIQVSDMLPSPAQGAVGLQIREHETRIGEWLMPVCCENTAIELAAERAFLAALDGSCRTPIAALARITANRLHFVGEVYTPDAKHFWQQQAKIDFATEDDRISLAAQAGKRAGEMIAEEAGDLVRFDI